MAHKIEMSLDQIIKADKIGFRRSSGGAKTQVSGADLRKFKPKFTGTANREISKSKGRPSFGQKFTTGKREKKIAFKHDLVSGKNLLRAAVASGSTKLLVSNLDSSVSQNDIRELFADFGPLKSASVRRSAHSLKTAEVVFERRNDAMKAMRQYDGVPLDNRPMIIELVVSNISVNLPAPVGSNRPTFGQNRNQSRGKLNGKPQGKSGQPQQSKQSQGSKNKVVRKPVSAEELDAELDAYIVSKNIASDNASKEASNETSNEASNEVLKSH